MLGVTWATYLCLSSCQVVETPPVLILLNTLTLASVEGILYCIVYKLGRKAPDPPEPKEARLYLIGIWH